MVKFLSCIINIFLKVFKVKKNKIVFEAGRDLVDGNTKAVYDYIKQNPNLFDVVWIVTKNTDVKELDPKDYVYYRTFKSFYHLATAHYLIRSQSIGGIYKKKKNQIYIQLWHGNGAMKHMGYDSTNSEYRPEVEHVSKWDYYIANDELDAEHIITSTGYKGKVDILGMACFDITLRLSKDKKFKEKVLKEIGIDDICKNKKIVLYAPTFRDYELNGDKINVPIEKLSKLKDCIILLRLHPLVRKQINTDIFKHKNIINACNYPDASDLLAICDVLITDYSSIFYQYSPLNRPIIFYPYDFEEYKKLRGGFYLNYEEDLPGAICYNENELYEALLDIEKTHKDYCNKQKKFNSKYNYLADGNASKRFVEKLKNGEYDIGR